MKHNNDISIVIPTRNRAHILSKTLQALVENDLGAYKAAIILVDDGSTDETQHVFERWEKMSNLFFCYLRQEKKGACAALNLGIKSALGEYIILLDDDMLVSENFVLRHLKCHLVLQRPEAVIVGSNSFYPELSILDAVFNPSRQFLGGDKLSLANWTDFRNCNVSFRRDFFISTGLFDEELEAFYDLEMGYRLVKHGAIIYKSPQLYTKHLCPTIGINSFLARAEDHGKSLAVWCKKHPQLISDIQALGKASSDFGFPITNDTSWQMIKDRVDRVTINRFTYWPLLILAKISWMAFKPLSIRLFRRLYRYKLKSAYEQAVKHTSYV